jgi:hypothetical protein
LEHIRQSQSSKSSGEKIPPVLTLYYSGDRLLTDALQLMSNEGLTSLAVVDNALNVVGNISTADVKLLTNTSSLPLLKSSCIHFISVILTERGIGDGKDSFPGKFYLVVKICCDPLASQV